MFEEDYDANGAREYIKPASTSRKKVVQCDLEGNLIYKG